MVERRTQIAAPGAVLSCQRRRLESAIAALDAGDDTSEGSVADGQNLSISARVVGCRLGRRCISANRFSIGEILNKPDRHSI